jgi:hydrogenase maturation factor
MNLLYGDIVEVCEQQGMRCGKVRIGGACKLISLDLLTDPRPGDTVLLCEGVALNKVEKADSRGIDHVPRHTR